MKREAKSWTITRFCVRNRERNRGQLGHFGCSSKGIFAADGMVRRNNSFIVIIIIIIIITSKKDYIKNKKESLCIVQILCSTQKSKVANIREQKKNFCLFTQTFIFSSFFFKIAIYICFLFIYCVSLLLLLFFFYLFFVEFFASLCVRVRVKVDLLWYGISFFFF